MFEKQLRVKSQDGHPKQRAVMTFEDIFRIIIRRKYGILLSVVFSFATVLLYHNLITPEYHAESIVMINDNQDQNDLFSKVLGPGSGINDNKSVKKDAELIRSMPISELAVRELSRSNQNKSLELFGGRPYLSPLAMLLKPVIPLFAAQNSDQRANSDENLRQLAIKLNDRIRVEPVRETNVLKVSVASPFSDESALLTNTICRIYRDADISRNSEKYAQANRFIAEMLKEQQEKVAEADNALSKYMSKNEIYEMTGNTQQLLDKLVEVDAHYNDIQAEYNIARHSLGFLDSKLSEAEKALTSRIAQNVTNELGSIMDEIRTNENDYVRLVRERGIDAPEVKAKKQQLDVVKARYDQLNRSKIAGQIGYAGRAQKFSYDMVSEKLQIERKLSELNFSATEFNRMKQYYENQLNRLPTKQQEFVKLQRDREAVSKTYVFLKEKLDESRILLGSEVGSVSVVGAAFQPPAPEKPDMKKTMLLGLLLSGIVASVYTYGAELVDDTIHDKSFFVDNNLGRVFMIPFISDNFQASSPKVEESVENYDSSINSELSVKESSNTFTPKITGQLRSPFTESFRIIRAYLDHLSDGEKQSILVSGTGMKEGTSTICANLGIAFAQTGRRTLIIDCNVFRASMHKIFNCKKEDGLSDYIMSSLDNFDSRFIKKTDIQNLFLVSAGNIVSNPGELFGSDKMHDLMKELKGDFDRILLDCPPLFISDGIQLVDSVDGIVLVSRLDHTRRKALQDLMDDQFLNEQMLCFAVVASDYAEVQHYLPNNEQEV